MHAGRHTRHTPAGICGGCWTETRISPTESPTDRLDLFAIAAPGVEPLVERELRAHGMADVRVDAGGVAFTGGREAMYRANLHLRTATRVIARVAEFEARGLPELAKNTKRQPWERFLDRNRPVRLRVTCRKSRLYHSGAVAERVANGIAQRLRVDGIEAVKGSHEDEVSNAQLIIARVAHDRCVLSVDSSGALLHRRGYREATAKAPIRETLAAALLVAADWCGDAPLLDPFCGSGTIAIEGALLARRIPPGLHRRFAFMDWPDFDATLWTHLRDEATGHSLARVPVPVRGSDRDAGAVEAARANAERARVAGDVEFQQRPISAIEPPSGQGWVCTNPPYGIRVSERGALRDLYAQFGKVLRARCAGWTVAMFSADTRLERATRLALRPILRTRNGGIPVRVVRGRVSD